MTNIKYAGKPVTVTIGQSSVVEIPARVFRIRLTGFLFETAKTFLLPSAMEGIRALVDYYRDHPDMAVVVTGHTDTVGTAGDNLSLSSERATSIAHFLKDEVDPWLACYNGSPASLAWGTREDQHMLSALKYYDGPVHGVLDAPTVDAVKRYQTDRALTVDGQPGPQTRRSLITDYMGLDGTSLPASVDLAKLGCGENHLETPTGDEVDEASNRRVEVFFFDPPPADPACPSSCPGDGCPYLEWKKRAAETQDVDHPLCELLVRVTDDDGQAIADADVTLSRDGTVEREQPSDKNGQAWFQNLTEGKYRLAGAKDGYRRVERDVTVVPGGLAAYKDTSSDTSNVDSLVPSRPGPIDPPNEEVSVPLVLPRTGPFIIQLKDPDEVVNAQPRPNGLKGGGGEARFDWSGESVDLVFGDRKTATVQADKSGVCKFDYPGDTDIANIEAIHKKGPHSTPVKWHVFAEQDFPRIDTVPAELSTRVRVSIWSFHEPFDAGTDGPDGLANLDANLLGDVPVDSLDDLSLVNTVLIDEHSVFDGKGSSVSGYTLDKTKTPRLRWATESDFSGSNLWFAPGANPSRCESYCRALVTKMHEKNIEVLAGFCLGTKDGLNPESAFFLRFLEECDPDKQIPELAEAFAAFCETSGFDGIGFDIEIDGMGFPKPPNDTNKALIARAQKRADNLARLYQETAKALAKTNRWASYANGPFDPDGEGVEDLMKSQKFGVAFGIPNLVSRPQCFTQPSMGPDRIVRGLDCALRARSDNGGGELHPAQLQMGIFEGGLKQIVLTGSNTVGGATTTENDADRAVVAHLGIGGSFSDTLCTAALRPSRVGMIIYNFELGPGSKEMLKRCAHYDGLLNPSLPRGEGQPFQVPRTKDPLPKPEHQVVIAASKDRKDPIRIGGTTTHVNAAKKDWPFVP